MKTLPNQVFHFATSPWRQHRKFFDDLFVVFSRFHIRSRSVFLPLRFREILWCHRRCIDRSLFGVIRASRNSSPRPRRRRRANKTCGDIADLVQNRFRKVLAVRGPPKLVARLSRGRFQSIVYPRSRRTNTLSSASLLYVDLTHPFLLANDLDLIA
jgi:hypothetical protein